MSVKDDIVVVIGNGMVGYKLCELVADARGFKQNPIIVFGEEPRAADDRVHLTEFLSGRSAEDLTLASSERSANHGIELRTGDATPSGTNGDGPSRDALVHQRNRHCGAQPTVALRTTTL